MQYVDVRSDELNVYFSAENKTTYKYNRDSRSPRSAISTLFHDLLFQGDDDGFVKAPGVYWEQELFPKYFSVTDSSASEIACKGCGSVSVNPKMEGNRIVVECLDCSEMSEYKGE